MWSSWSWSSSLTQLMRPPLSLRGPHCPHLRDEGGFAQMAQYARRAQTNPAWRGSVTTGSLCQVRPCRPVSWVYLSEVEVPCRGWCCPRSRSWSSWSWSSSLTQLMRPPLSLRGPHCPHLRDEGGFAQMAQYARRAQTHPAWMGSVTTGSLCQVRPCRPVSWVYFSEVEVLCRGWCWS